MVCRRHATYRHRTAERVDRGPLTRGFSVCFITSIRAAHYYYFYRSTDRSLVRFSGRLTGFAQALARGK